MAVVGLFHGEISLWELVLDQDQIVKGDLQGRVAGTGPTKRLLDEGAQRKHTRAVGLVATDHRRCGPDRLDDLGGRINEVVDKGQLALGLPDQWRRASMAGRSGVGGAPRVLAE